MSLMGKGLFICIFLTFGFNRILPAQIANISSEIQDKEIHPNIIVVKLKTIGKSNGRTVYSKDTQLDKIKQIIDFKEYYQVFASKSKANARTESSHLQNIYKIKLKPNSNIHSEIAKLQNLDFIEYAEPYFQHKLLLIPNDPQADPDGGLQDYLAVIKAYEGWDIEKSDSTMVIGIVDTGVNMNHEDLGNIAFNYADSLNGVDDDGDGYIDNFYGWDIADNDNDPTADGHPHGSSVTGLSSAKTNNGIGMAGVGFNSKYLPVKIAETSSRILINEYEGIIYAANHGCKVINLSWGGADHFSKYGQDIINYAVLEKDVVVVAAAGNTHDELNFYPASFENVLSVGATDINDNLAGWATYSHHIDIMAPGENVYTTRNNGDYEINTGSSLSAPLVAGAAALVRAHFPELSALQVMEQLRSTADDIYAIGSNMDYFGLLGKGRLNVQSALNNILTPSIRLSSFQYQSNHRDLIFPGDTVNVNLIFTNYLRIAENVTITISNPSNNVSMEADKIYIDRLEALKSYEDTENPLKFIVNQESAADERLIFRIDYIGNNYSDFQYFEIRTTPKYFDITDGKLTATIASDGDIGYDESFVNHGNGINFNGARIAEQAGLIISLDSAHVMDNVINDYGTGTRDEDFVNETYAKLYDNSIADLDARSAFKPKDTVLSKLNIKLEQKVLTWENNTQDGSVIFEYRIINNGDSALNGLNTGLFADWDLGDYNSNEAGWDADYNLGYVFNKSNIDLYSGLAILTNQNPSYYAIDLRNENGNTADFDTIFNDIVKHKFISTDNKKLTAGTVGAGNDVAHIVGGNKIDLAPGQSIKIAFAMLASNSLDGLRSALSLAKGHYIDYLNDAPLAETFYACNSDSAIIDPEGELYEFYEDLGLTNRLDSGTIFKTDPVLMDKFYYAINLDSGYASDIMKLQVSPGNPTADFNFPADTFLIEQGKSGEMVIENTSILSNGWYWDFGNGYSSIVKNPTVIYDQPGTYSVELIAENRYGCADSISQELLVAVRSERAVLENQNICKGTKATLSALNTSEINIYKDKLLTGLLFSGNSFETGQITNDTAFYITNTFGEFESVASEIQISVKYPEMGIEYQIDTLNLNEKYVLNIYNSRGQTDPILWMVNDNFISDKLSFNYAYSDSSFEISQIKVDAEGCRDTLVTTISPEYSTSPILKDVEICKNTDVLIQPENGTLFYFYDDASMNSLLHKGTSLYIDNITKPVTYYATGVDGFLESASAAINISLDPVKAIIEATADTIFLAEENTVEIYNKSVNAKESFWIDQTGAFDTTKNLVKSYDDIGAFEYTLIAQSSNGCLDTATYQILVVNITGLEDSDLHHLNVFPNPTSDLLTIDLGQSIYGEYRFELLDISGKTIQSFVISSDESFHRLNFSGLKNGIYFIRSINNAIPITVKVLKQ